MPPKRAVAPKLTKHDLMDVVLHYLHKSEMKEKERLKFIMDYFTAVDLDMIATDLRRLVEQPPAA